MADIRIILSVGQSRSCHREDGDDDDVDDNSDDDEDVVKVILHENLLVLLFPRWNGWNLIEAVIKVMGTRTRPYSSSPSYLTSICS